MHDAIEEIALKEMGLDIYPNQIEVITSEQMLDAYASVGLPLMYRHWSFGKRFAREEALYRHGLQGLAYEIVINSSPCISYIMEENSMAMQTLVIAHAAFGHNHFFKNNYLFRQWTDADGILDYLTFARDFVARCEDAHGVAEVERVLDAAHALMNQGACTATRAGPRTTSERSAGAPRSAAFTTSATTTISGSAWCQSARPRTSMPPSSRKSGRRPAASSACPRRTCSISWRSARRAYKAGSASSCGSPATSASTSIRRSRRG